MDTEKDTQATEAEDTEGEGWQVKSAIPEEDTEGQKFLVRQAIPEDDKGDDTEGQVFNPVKS